MADNTISNQSIDYFLTVVCGEIANSSVKGQDEANEKMKAAYWLKEMIKTIKDMTGPEMDQFLANIGASSAKESLSASQVNALNQFSGFEGKLKDAEDKLDAAKKQLDDDTYQYNHGKPVLRFLNNTFACGSFDVTGLGSKIAVNGPDDKAIKTAQQDEQGLIQTTTGKLNSEQSVLENTQKQVLSALQNTLESAMKASFGCNQNNES